jgi:hypothetical protein
MVDSHPVFDLAARNPQLGEFYTHSDRLILAHWLYDALWDSVLFLEQMGEYDKLVKEYKLGSGATLVEMAKALKKLQLPDIDSGLWDLWYKAPWKAAWGSKVGKVVGGTAALTAAQQASDYYSTPAGSFSVLPPIQGPANSPWSPLTAAGSALYADPYGALGMAAGTAYGAAETAATTALGAVNPYYFGGAVALGTLLGVISSRSYHGNNLEMILALYTAITDEFAQVFRQLVELLAAGGLSKGKRDQVLMVAAGLEEVLVPPGLCRPHESSNYKWPAGCRDTNFALLGQAVKEGKPMLLDRLRRSMHHPRSKSSLKRYVHS